MVTPHRAVRGIKRCVICDVSSAELYAHPSRAAAGDFRVVCREPECAYGHFEDRDGHGYSNHGTVALAQAALVEHQRAVDDAPHAAQIEQHPRPEVTGRG